MLCTCHRRLPSTQPGSAWNTSIQVARISGCPESCHLEWEAATCPRSPGPCGASAHCCLVFLIDWQGHIGAQYASVILPMLCTIMVRSAGGFAIHQMFCRTYWLVIAHDQQSSRVSFIWIVMLLIQRGVYGGYMQLFGLPISSHASSLSRLIG